jgi:hypothetical protein
MGRVNNAAAISQQSERVPCSSAATNVTAMPAVKVTTIFAVLMTWRK